MKMKAWSGLVFAICLQINVLLSQNIVQDSSILNGLELMRNSILEGQANEIAELNSIFNRWKKYEKDEKIIKFLFHNISYSSAIENSSIKKIRKKIRKFVPSTKLDDVISQDDIDVIKSNSEFISYDNKGFIEREVPYKTTLENITVFELNFLNLSKNEEILDIGSGDGTFVLLTAIIYPENKYTLNEINEGLIVYLENRISKHQSLLEHISEIKVAKGTSKELNLNANFDRVIIRNTFHHFKHKNKMIDSILKCLNSDGTIIIIEKLKSQAAKLECKQKLSEKEIVDYFKNDERLKIVQKEIYDETLFMKINRNHSDNIR